jgi:surface antigen
VAGRSATWLSAFSRGTLALASLLLGATLISQPASASVATTTHETPWAGEVGVTALCLPNAGYVCTDAGYNTWAASPSGWAWSEYGNGIASENSYGPHNCTLYVAYRLQESGLAYPGWHDNADNWATRAANLGTAVDVTPSIGAVAQWNSPSTDGHVAIVEQVTSSYIVVTADNYSSASATYMPGGYSDSYEIALTSPAMPDNFIHFATTVATPSAPSNGSFVSYLSKNYVIAGGAPEYISGWAAVGGLQPTQALSAAQWSELAATPANGTLVCAGGDIYVVAGGAPEYVSSWAAIGGEQPCVTIDPADIAKAGSNAPWNHLSLVPSNGTFLYDAATGTSYETVGGLALAVDSCVVVSGCATEVSVDPGMFDNVGGGAPWNHVATAPANGTLLDDTTTSTYWTVTNGCRTESAAPLVSPVALDDAMLNEISACFTIPSVPTYQSLVAHKGSLIIRIRPAPAPALAVTTYQYSLNAGKSWRSEPSKGAPIIVVRFLTPQHSYAITVRSLGDRGASAPSKVVVAKIP